MVNLPGSRKNNDQKNLKYLSKKTNKIQLVNKNNFEEILLIFENHFKENISVFQLPNQSLSNCIRQFLASLKSILDKDIKIQLSNEEQITNSVINILNILNEIYSNDSVFPETITLSTICVSFLLINYIKSLLKNYSDNVSIRISLIVYLNLFHESRFNQNDFEKKVQFALDSAIQNQKNISAIINEMIINKKNVELKFREAALFHGLLNCHPMIKLMLNDSIEAFFSIFPQLIQLCNRNLNHEFHVYRLLNQYLKIYLEYEKSIEIRMNDSYDFHLLNVFKQTLPIIDRNWESPINGVNNIIKQNYQFLIELIKISCNSKELIIEQFKSVSDLPFTCKAKYKKLTVLTQILGKEKWKIERNGNICELPFELCPNFAIQVIKHLSLNLLSTSIAEYYKSSIIAIVSSNYGLKLTLKWSKLWLEALTYIFKSDLIQSTVVQNTLLAHILPSTIKNIPESINLLMTKLSDCLYGQACLIRIFIDKFTIEKSHSILPQTQWLLTILSDSDDMTRAEGLALLLEEKFINKNRSLVCKLALIFLKNNLNIDNAAFRQKIICLFEQFFFKIINSLCDRFDSETKLSELNELHQSYVQFLSETLNLLALSLCPGSSFQRKFTALNLIGSIVELVEKEDRKYTLGNLLNQVEPKVPIMSLLLYGLIDKDDKIRRLCCEILIQYSKCSLSTSSFEFDLVHSLSIYYIQSFRHQECHIGGLLYKYLLRTKFITMSSIEFLIEKAINLFYSEQFRQNLLKSSQTDPLHGWILALNHCFTFDTFYEGVLSNNQLNINLKLKQKIISPTIQMALDSLEYFLKLLTPKTNCNLEYDGFDEIDLEDNYTSPSFLEMCESIKRIIQSSDESDFDDSEDFSSTNKFQLILSMCWLNLKESCFLLTNITSLFADLLSFKQSQEIDLFQLLISPEELYQIGIKIVMLMQKCRHKGVIEASGISLTKFTRAFLRIHHYLNQFASESIRKSYNLACKKFINYILDVISMVNQTKSSITRRSAGLALIIQSVLIGEAESIHLDGITPFNDVTLYEQFISLLISISQMPVKDNESGKNDLQQANALHVLRSIIGTSALSHLSYKMMEDFFPIWVKGFTCLHWQIRNASLQFFGACVTRMLGQKKRSKTKDWESNEFESTITFNEFYCRYPNLLKLICDHFESMLNNNKLVHRPELVPLLALLASFTPVGQYEFTIEEKKRLKDSLINYLSNHSWKIRMLAAKSLSSLLTISEFEIFIIESLSKQITSNYFHGMLCCTNYLIEIKSISHPEQIEEYRSNLHKHFEPHFKNIGAYYILEPLIKSIFSTDRRQLNEDVMKNDKEESDDTKIHTNPIELCLIKSNISFKQPDNIRMKAAQDMSHFIEKLKPTRSIEEMIEIADIMIILFEDEDRQIRFEAQRMASILFRQCNPKIEFNVFSQNIAIDCFLQWLLLHSNWKQILFELINLRLSISETYLLSGEQEIDILFEKEEKNVFAEPYLMNIRLINFLIDHLNSDNTFKNFPYFKKFLKLLDLFKNEFECQFIETKFEQHLLTQSIWKLPKFFCVIINLYLSLKLAIVLDGSNGYKKTLQQIDEHFPYVKLLCTNFNSFGFDLIDFNL